MLERNEHRVSPAGDVGGVHLGRQAGLGDERPWPKLARWIPQDDQLQIVRTTLEFVARQQACLEASRDLGLSLEHLDLGPDPGLNSRSRFASSSSPSSRDETLTVHCSRAATRSQYAS